MKEGKSAVNESMITGESKPVDKTAGEKVIAGTVNGQGSLRIEVTGTGEQTALAGIMRLVEQAQSSRSRAQALADRAAFFLTIIAIASAALTAIVWPVARAAVGLHDGAGGDRARDRLPARAGAGHSPGDCDLHHAWRARTACSCAIAAASKRLAS